MAFRIVCCSIVALSLALCPVAFGQEGTGSDRTREIQELEGKVAELNKRLAQLKDAPTTQRPEPVRVGVAPRGADGKLRIWRIGDDGKMMEVSPALPNTGKPRIAPVRTVPKAEPGPDRGFKIIGPDGREIKDAKLIGPDGREIERLPVLPRLPTEI